MSAVAPAGLGCSTPYDSTRDSDGQGTGSSLELTSPTRAEESALSVAHRCWKKGQRMVKLTRSEEMADEG